MRFGAIKMVLSDFGPRCRLCAPCLALPVLDMLWTLESLQVLRLQGSGKVAAGHCLSRAASAVAADSGSMQEQSREEWWSYAQMGVA